MADTRAIGPRTNGLCSRRYCGVGKIAARFRRVAARPLFVLKPRLLNKLVAAALRPRIGRYTERLTLG